MTTESIKLMPVRVDPTLLAEIAKLRQVNNGKARRLATAVATGRPHEEGTDRT